MLNSRYFQLDSKEEPTSASSNILDQPFLTASSELTPILKRSDVISSISTAKIEIRENHLETYDLVFPNTSNTFTNTKALIKKALTTTESEINSSACKDISTGSLKGACVGGAFGSATGLWASIGAAVLAALPFCICGLCLLCDKDTTPQDINDAASSDCCHESCNVLCKFVCCTGKLLSDSDLAPKVAMWGAASGAGIGCFVGAAIGHCEHQKRIQSAEQRLSLLNKLYRLYSAAEHYASNEKDLINETAPITPNMTRDDDKKAVVELRQNTSAAPVTPTRTPFDFFPLDVKKTESTISVASNDQKPTFNQSMSIKNS